MYKSLARQCEHFHLYIFAFCDVSLQLLRTLNLPHVTIVSLDELEDEALLEIKPTRTRGEYCWTCASSILWYCLVKLNLSHCTYVDADIYFYSDPQILIDEMGAASVLITEHRFSPNYMGSVRFGRYCVQFMTFKNTPQGLQVLAWWRNACLTWCYNRLEGGKFGDQKYLDDWTTRFEGVHVLGHLGGGVAPWNLQQYHFKKTKSQFYLLDSATGSRHDIVFFHFHNVKIKSGRVDAEHLYKTYTMTYHAYAMFYWGYLKEVRALTRTLHLTCPQIIPVRLTIAVFPLLKSMTKEFRHWLLIVRLSKRCKVIRVMGFYLWHHDDSDTSAQLS